MLIGCDGGGCGAVKGVLDPETVGSSGSHSALVETKLAGSTAGSSDSKKERRSEE